METTEITETMETTDKEKNENIAIVTKFFDEHVHLFSSKDLSHIIEASCDEFVTLIEKIKNDKNIQTEHTGECHFLIACYFKNKDRKVYKQHLKLGINKGCRNALTEYGICKMESGHIERAKNCFHMAHNMPYKYSNNLDYDVNALYFFGIVLFNSIMAIDKITAIECFKIAARNKHIQSMKWLAKYCEENNLHEQSKKWNEKIEKIEK
jgi:hypothetical protein